MVRAARKGRRVVRLKGGDPFLFGRGGEEVQALQVAGVPFDVVPGVASALAVPALAGIPVTHRGIASALLVVSGHDERLFADTIGALRPDGVTLVILMGYGRRIAIASQLIARGWARDTPAAIVADGSLPQQQTWRCVEGDHVHLRPCQIEAERARRRGAQVACLRPERTAQISQTDAQAEQRVRVGTRAENSERCLMECLCLQPMS